MKQTVVSPLIHAIAWLLLLPLAGACSREEQEATPQKAQEGTPPGNEGRPIAFRSEVVSGIGPGTRAVIDSYREGTRTDEDAYRGSTRAGEETFCGKGELTTELLQQTGFGVYCWYTGSTHFDNFAAPHTHIQDYLGTTGYLLMRNQLVGYDATSSHPQWTYSPTKYWPLAPAELLTLRAYAPFTTYLLTDSRGLPQLPVMVAATDFCNDCQHDPLWGTSRHTGTKAGTEGRYGDPYDNYTFAMSGDDLTDDARDGTIDWYFHHGMAKFTMEASILEAEEGTEVRITQISFTPLYDKGLLNIFSSLSGSASEKPVWDDRSGDMDVTLGSQHGDPAHHDLKDVVLTAGVYQKISQYGLLVIPRDYTAGPMTVTVTYTETQGESVSTKSVTGKIDFNVEGNTVYALQLLLNVEQNTLYIRSFVNLDWQVGSHWTVDDL